MGSIVSMFSAAFRARRCERNVLDASTEGDSLYTDSSFASDEVPAAPTNFGK